MYFKPIYKIKMQFLDLKNPIDRQKFYHTSEWANAADQVKREEPLCRKCLERGFYTPTKHVDHIIPLTQRPDLALERNNLQGLCIKCHAQKTNEESNGFGARKRKVKIYRAKWNI